MKPKSFKSKEMGENNHAYGVSAKQKYFQQVTPKHLTFSVNQLVIDKEQISIQLSPLLDAKAPDWDFDVFALDDIVFLAIGDSTEIVTAKVADDRPMGDQAMLVEYTPEPNQQYLRSSKPLPSPQWKSFLKELKKKCGSGHHNKKQKTLLHGVIVAKALAAKPERIQLTVRPAKEVVLVNAQAFEDQVTQIRGAMAEAVQAGESVTLDDIGKFFPEDHEVVEAKYAPPAAEAEAMTLVVNGAQIRRDLAGSKETIRISKKLLDNAVKVHTRDLLSLSDQEVSWIVAAYNHGHNLITHDNITIKNISVSRDGLDYNLELEPEIEARTQSPLNDGSFLFVISGSKAALNEAGESAPMDRDHLERGVMAISPGRFKFLAESNDGDYQPQLLITEQLRTQTLSSEFKEGGLHLMSVGNTQTVVSVTKVKIDAVKNKATVMFDYKGGDRIRKAPRGKLSMKRVLEAFPVIDGALTLTLEKEEDPEQAKLEEITAEINQFLQDDLDKYVNMEELADWQNQKYPDYNLKVTGAGYGAQRKAYETSSSVSGGLDIEARESEDRIFSFIDLQAIENVQSLVNISKFVGDAPEPVSEVEERSLAIQLEEIREAQLDVVPGGGFPVGYGYMSIYNGEVGHSVCNNEQIYRILRKKKDGKCIYRIVVKKGVRANQIAHGKHQMCVMFIDRQTVQQIFD